MIPSSYHLLPLAVGELLLAIGMFACAFYLFWLYLIRSEDKELFWAGMVCLTSGGYAACNIPLYIPAWAGDPWAHVYLIRLSFASLVTMQWAVLGFTATVYTSRAAGAEPSDRGPREWVKTLRRWVGWITIGFIVVTLFSSLVIGGNPVEVPLYLHPSAVFSPGERPLTYLAYAWSIAITLLGWGLLLLGLPRVGWADRALLLTLPLAVVAGLHDAVAVATVDTISLPFLLEWGLSGVAFSLFARTMQQHEWHHRAEIRARVNAERALDETLGSSPAPLAICDDKILFVNHAWARLCEAAWVKAGPRRAEHTSDDGAGLSPETTVDPKVLQGQPWSRLLPPEHRALLKALLSQGAPSTADGGSLPSQPVNETEMKPIGLTGSDGKVRELELSVMSMNYRGEAVQMIMARDVTDLRRMRAQMMAMDRVAAIGTLAAGVAHEINNPLSYMSANLELIAEDLESLKAGHLGAEVLGAKIEPNLEDARDGATRIRRIVADLKNSARGPTAGEENTPRRVQVVPCLEAGLRLVANLAKQRASLESELSDCGSVFLPEGQLSQIIINLLTNAIYAIPAIPEESVAGQTPSKVVLRCCAAPETDTALPAAPDKRAATSRAEVNGPAAPRLGVRIEVEDNGHGIEPEHLDQIFDPFFTTRPVGEGTGLGLSICQGMVREAGGSLRVESTLGVGTRFEIWLPCPPVAQAQV